jgi:hypothetical protein
VVNTAEQTARNAEASTTNKLGFCLQWCREKAGIPALYGTAAIAAAHAEDLHRDLNVPRGGFAFWTGGSDGAGHIAIGLGHGVVRSTDAGGPGRVADKPVEWFATNWHLTYVGWADNVNGVTVPGVGDWFAMATEAELRAIVREEIAANAPVPPSPGDIAKAVLAGIVREATATKKALSLRGAVRETFEKVTGR